MNKSRLFVDLQKFLKNKFVLDIIDIFYLIGINNNDEFKLNHKKLNYDKILKLDDKLNTENSVFIINISKIAISDCEKIIQKLSNKNFDFLILIEDHNCIINNYIKDNFSKKFQIWKQINKSFTNFTDDIHENKIIFFKMDNPNYPSDLFIQGTSNDDILPKIKYVKYKNENYTLQDDFLKLIEKINFHFKKKSHFSIMRFNDGDFYFLRRLPIGSAKPGSRSVTKNYNQIDINFYRKNFFKNSISLERHIYAYNYFCLELVLSYLDPFYDFIKIKFNSKIYILPNIILHKFFHSDFFHRIQNIKYFRKFLNFLVKTKLYNNKSHHHYHDYVNNSFVAGESIRSIISTRWIFKKYQSSIGLIGNEDKINLIKKLMTYSEYKNYLGINNFNDYISIKTKGAADDFRFAKELKNKIIKSEAKIFLLGIGSLKITLLPLLKDVNKIFIDVGVGIDAIAGIISNDRPFFKRWINFQLTDFEYDSIDLMDQNNPNRFSDKYKKVILKR